MTKKKDIEEHNRKVLKMILEDKQESVVAKKIVKESPPKIGAEAIRSAYFKNWYESCKDIYNKERRRKRKENKKKGKNNGNS